MVTLSVDKVNFKEPIHVGELVTFLASVNHVGRTSNGNRHPRGSAEYSKNATVRHTNSCYFTMVAVDESGKAEADSCAGIWTMTGSGRCFEAAEQRKIARLQENHHPSADYKKSAHS